jgi:hypothetical protein
MATVQIDESELLNQQRVLAKVNNMLAHPEARKLLLRASKIQDPAANIPEIDAAAPVLTEVDALKKALAEDKAERKAEREAEAQERAMAQARATVASQKQRLREQGWRDEGIEEIEKFATERGVPDLEIAASHWEKLHPPSEPATPNGSGSWGFFDDQQADNDKKFVESMINTKGEDEGALNSEIRAALAEVRGQRVGR